LIHGCNGNGQGKVEGELGLLVGCLIVMGEVED